MQDWTEPVFVENRQAINGPFGPLSNSLMLQMLGNPRGTYSQQCQPVTNLRIRRLIVTEDVGPFRVTGLAPAVASLRDILREVKEKHRTIHDQLGSAGMLCCRYVRGSNTSISNHSWGCAIDLTIAGKLDFRGDGKVQRGLKEIFPIFHKHRWFWGAAFRTEDAMHFEVSRQLLLEWQAAGRLGDAPAVAAADNNVIDLGDRGPAVKDLQRRINILTGAGIDEDGVFGPATRAALIAFQNAQALRPTGFVDDATKDALDEVQPV